MTLAARERPRCSREAPPRPTSTSPPGRCGGADAGDRRYPGTSAEADPGLLAVRPFFVPAGDGYSPFLGEDRVGSPPGWEAALELAAWCRASPVDGLRRGVPSRMAESYRLATQCELGMQGEQAAAERCH